jgi:repressor of nif and glnA expression
MTANTAGVHHESLSLLARHHEPVGVGTTVLHPRTCGIFLSERTVGRCLRSTEVQSLVDKVGVDGRGITARIRPDVGIR